MNINNVRLKRKKFDTRVHRINEEIAAINKEYGSWEQLKQFRLLPNEFSIEGGELTPTLKFKRKKILEKYQDVYKQIYPA